MNIEQVWRNIKAHEGETFFTKKGKEFTYHMTDRLVILENTNRNIPIGNFEKAIGVTNPSVVAFQKMNLQGPSYIYGIITDERIQK
jgi:hypothetical protein